MIITYSPYPCYNRRQARLWWQRAKVSDQFLLCQAERADRFPAAGRKSQFDEIFIQLL